MKKIKQVIIAVLLLILLGLIFYVFKLNKENTVYKEDVLKEKQLLEEELNLTIKDLNANQQQNISITKDFNNTNNKLKSIRNELKTTKQIVQNLKQKLISSQKNSFRELQNLRETLGNVKKNNQFLFKSLDSIRTLNDSLMVTIAVTKSELNSEKLQSKELALKLSDATKIQITKVEVYTVEQKKSGEIKETNRYKKANGIQVKYNVLNNKALSNTECDIFYVLKNEENLLVATNGEFMYNGVLKKFTDGTRLVLDGNTKPVSDVISLQEAVLKKGTYNLEFYSVDGLLAKESFTLKKGFLGVF